MLALQLTARCLPFVLILVLLAGCDDGKLQLGSVTGQVTVDGKPLPAGQIVFITDTRRAFGTIKNGEIMEVTTYQAGDGVTLGKHRVAIRPKIDESEMMKPPSQRKPDPYAKLVPKKYHDAQTSELSAQIKRGQNPLVFELSTK
ncbi:MAG: hypothetical protein AAFN77_23555 [Planctomycetota bacterium]